MIDYRQGDIFASGAESLVNPVNCMGTHGKGLALEFKRRWPYAIRCFNDHCEIGEAEPGVVFNECIGAGRYILFFPTKVRWHEPSRLEWIESGLVDLVAVVSELGVRSVAIPALGCGLGGLAWSDVQPLIHAAAEKMAAAGVAVFVYEPGAP